jgi:4'-phosphopantetheinyl transferase
MTARASAGPRATTGESRAWPSGPKRPMLPKGVVDVWRADLNAVADDVLAALTGGERERAAGIMGRCERTLWSRSRGVLRELLARYLQGETGDVELTIGAHGKPELPVDADRHTNLFFNLSHSRDLALYAFSVDKPVGVDVQVAQGARPGRTVDEVDLARRAFGEHEAERLNLIEPARREQEFLRAWTRYEAELKRLGKGIGGHRVRDDGSRARVASPCASPFTVELDVGQGAAAALALAGPARELRRWTWAKGSSG